MEYVKIGGIVWDVCITGISRSFEIKQSDNSGETLAAGARLFLDPIGTYISHEIRIRRRGKKDEVFDSLWDFLAVPRTEPVDVEIVYNQSLIKYKAYISSGDQELERIDPKTGRVFWGELTVSLTPVEAQFLP